MLTDINAEMLGQGRDRLLDAGIAAVTSTTCRPTPRSLPFADSSFDCVTIAFGLRNVTDKAAALASMRRVLKPGGQLDRAGILQTPVDSAAASPLYDAYSFRILPLLGQVIAGEGRSQLSLSG